MVLTTAVTNENTARPALDNPNHPLNQISLKIRDSAFNIHRAQLLTYMKINKSSLGYLINFNEKLIKDGIYRYVL